MPKNENFTQKQNYIIIVIINIIKQPKRKSLANYLTIITLEETTLFIYVRIDEIEYLNRVILSNR